MKILIVCLATVLTCSCQRSCQVKMTRHEEVLRVMRNATLRELLDTAYWLAAAERRELRRMQSDYHAKGGHWLYLTVPGPGWKLRGPLTFAEVKAKHVERVERGLQARARVYGDLKTRADTEPDVSWDEFASQYREGDELYEYRSSDRSWAELCGRRGYVLIRENQVVGKYVTHIN